MSQLEVDKIIPQSGTTLTIGDSGDTITFGTGTTPQLGGDLDLNSNDITGTGNINITGTVTATSFSGDGSSLTGITSVGGAVGVDFNDNVKARFGTGNDLEIYHDGSDSLLVDNGTGKIQVRSNGDNIEIASSKTTLEKMANFVCDGASELYYDGSKKFETTSTGVTINGGTNTNVFFQTTGSGTSGTDGMVVGNVGGDSSSYQFYNYESGYMRFATSGSEAMRIDSSGNVLVGKTSANYTSKGVWLKGSDGQNYFTSQSQPTIHINRLTSDGELIKFNKDGATVGSISSQDGLTINIDGGGARAGIVFVSTAWFPRKNGALVDNTLDLGSGSYRFDDLFATNGTIQTSDQNEKQSIQSLTASEMAVAQRISKLFKTFKWNSAVEEKGDSARTHTGIIAQDVQQAFADEGLDAGDYALFISDTWWEKEISVDAVAEELDEEGNILVEGKDAYTYLDTKEEATEGYTERTRLGIRYPELLSFVSSAFEQRLTNIETRLTALET